MKSGISMLRFDRMVTFQKPTEELTDGGTPMGEFIDAMTAYVGIYPMSAREFIAASGEHSEVQYKVITRTAGITSNMRMVDGNKIYLIDGVLDFDMRGMFFTLVCREVV